MRIGLACISWEQPKGLERLLRSALWFDRIMVFDGRYKERKDGQELTPEYVEICKKHGAELFLTPNLQQYEKRNLYFQNSGDLDILIVLDDDEYLSYWNRYEFEVSFKNHRLKNRFAYKLPTLDKGQIGNNPRIFWNPTKCFYKDRHNMVWAENGEIFGRNIGPVIDGIRAVHDKTFRTEEREKLNYEYYMNYPRE